MFFAKSDNGSLSLEAHYLLSIGLIIPGQHLDQHCHHLDQHCHQYHYKPHKDLISTATRPESTVWMNREVSETTSMKDVINNPPYDITRCSYLLMSSHSTDQSLSRRQSSLWQRSSLSLNADTSLEDANCKTDEASKVPEEKYRSKGCRTMRSPQKPSTFVKSLQHRWKGLRITPAVSRWALEQLLFPDLSVHLDDALLLPSSPPQIWSMYWLLLTHGCYWLIVTCWPNVGGIPASERRLPWKLDTFVNFFHPPTSQANFFLGI